MAGKSWCITLRPATQPDASAMAAIESENGLPGWSEEAYREQLEARSTYGFVALGESGDIVGFVLGQIAADQAEIHKIAVSAALRRSGIASRLIRRALDETSGRGAVRMFLEVRSDNAPAIALYNRLSFTNQGVRKSYYGPGIDGIVMSISTE